MFRFRVSGPLWPLRATELSRTLFNIGSKASKPLHPHPINPNKTKKRSRLASGSVGCGLRFRVKGVVLGLINPKT